MGTEIRKNRLVQAIERGSTEGLGLNSKEHHIYRQASVETVAEKLDNLNKVLREPDTGNMSIECLRARVRVAERDIERAIDNLKDDTGLVVTGVMVHSETVISLDKGYPLKVDITVQGLRISEFFEEGAILRIVAKSGAVMRVVVERGATEGSVDLGVIAGDLETEKYELRLRIGDNEDSD